MKHTIKKIDLSIGKSQNSFKIDMTKVSKGNVIGVAFYINGDYPSENINIQFKDDDKGSVVMEWTHLKELERSKGANDFVSSLRPVNFKLEDVKIELSSSEPLTTELKGQVQFYFDVDYNGNKIKPQQLFTKSETGCIN